MLFLHRIKDKFFIKSFTTKEYAEAFIQGQLYCRPLISFQKTGDCREDTAEGKYSSLVKVSNKEVQSINLLGEENSNLIFLAKKAIEENICKENDVLRIDYTANMYNFSIGTFDYLPIYGDKYSRYKEFGNYWVIGSLIELLENIQCANSWILAYKVIYSDIKSGWCIKRTNYKVEDEIKFLFNKETTLSDCNPKFYNIAPLKTAKILIAK